MPLKIYVRELQHYFVSFQTVRYFNKQDDTETVGKKKEKSKKICNKKNGKKKIPDKDDVLIYKAKLKLNHYIQQKNSVKLHEV